MSNTGLSGLPQASLVLGAIAVVARAPAMLVDNLPMHAGRQSCGTRSRILCGVLRWPSRNPLIVAILIGSAIALHERQLPATGWSIATAASLDQQEDSR